MVEEEENCSICLSVLKNDNKNGIYTVDGCNHQFHTDCFLSWCKQGQFSCPLCRNDSICNINFMDKKTKLSFLRKYSLRKNSPLLLKEVANKVRKDEKSMLEYKKELKDFILNNKEIFDNLDKIRFKYRSQVIKYRKSVDNLVGYPLIQLPRNIHVL